MGYATSQIRQQTQVNPIATGIQNTRQSEADHITINNIDPHTRGNYCVGRRKQMRKKKPQVNHCKGLGPEEIAFERNGKIGTSECRARRPAEKPAAFERCCH